MATYVNRTHDSVAGAFVRWNTISPDTAGASYPGPGVFGVTALDYCVEHLNATGNTATAFFWVVTQTSLYATSAFEIVPVDPSGGVFQVDLPVAPVLGDMIMLVNITTSSNTVTVSGNGKNINLAASYAMTDPQEAILVSYNGTEWFIL